MNKNLSNLSMRDFITTSMEAMAITASINLPLNKSGPFFSAEATETDKWGYPCKIIIETEEKFPLNKTKVNDAKIIAGKNSNEGYLITEGWTIEMENVDDDHKDLWIIVLYVKGSGIRKKTLIQAIIAFIRTIMEIKREVLGKEPEEIYKGIIERFIEMGKIIQTHG